MPNVLKQIQDLGNVCWDKYVSGSELNALYINKTIDGCSVKQINFNSSFPIQTGIDGYFNTKIFTDYENNYFLQKTSSKEHQFSINLNTSNQSGNFKIGDLLNTDKKVFNEINLYIDTNKSNINFLNSRTKNISIDTSDIPNEKEAKFRCIKFNPNETEQTCIKILSTKEIILKCCGQGEIGFEGGGGGEGGAGGGGGGGGGGSIGIGGPTAFGSAGNIGIDGPMYIGDGPSGPDGALLKGDGGTNGIDGITLKGVDGSNGDGISERGSDGGGGSSGSPSTIIGFNGIEGQTVKGIDGGNGQGGFSDKGSDGFGGISIGGSQGPRGPAPNPGLAPGNGGVKGETRPYSDARGGSAGQKGPLDPGPYVNIPGSPGQGGGRGGGGGGGDKGEDASKGGGSGGAGGGGGSIGYLEGISKYIGFGDITYAPNAQRISVVGLTGFLNPYNKNDTTNNPVYGSGPGLVVP